VTTPALPAPAPVVNPETKPFWDATAEGRLLLPHCRNCDTYIWYPRLFCPACSSTDVEWVQASGRGTVYTFCIVRRGQGPYAKSAPYILGYVELAEGPRVMTNIVDCDVATVKIGDPVEVVFHDTGEGTALPRSPPVSA
jgi:uncharacterized protein